MRLVHDFTPVRRLPAPITFICAGCECVEHRRTPALPDGWTSQERGNDIHAFCADCTAAPSAEEFAARLRRDNIAFAAMLPMLIVGAVSLWTMLPA